MKTYPQLKRKFLYLSYPEAMKVASDISMRTGVMNWDQYKFYMTKYEKSRTKRLKPKQLTRQGGLVFAESIPAYTKK
jgi:hypothetical protein